jgi:ABC-type methionine transport system ATPase subunit
MKKKLNLIFPQHLIKEPVVYGLVKKFDIVFNIRRAHVNAKAGEMVLELEGSSEALEKAVGWLTDQGVRAEPVTHDAIEG